MGATDGDRLYKLAEKSLAVLAKVVPDLKLS